MSTYQASRASFSLESLTEACDRLNLQTLDTSCEQGLGDQRVATLGESLQEHREIFEQAKRQLDASDLAKLDETLDTLGNAASLRAALEQDEHALLGAATRHHLNTQEPSTQAREALQVIEEAGTHWAKQDLRTLEQSAPQLEDALQTLSQATEAAHEDLKQTERELLTEKTAESLQALGYQVRQKPNAGGVLIRGVQDDRSVAAQVTEGSTLHVDLAGFEGPTCEEGATCQQEMQRINEELARRGVELTVQAQNVHGKTRGDALAQEAAKKLPMTFNPLAEPSQAEDDREVQRKRLLHRQQSRQQRRQ